MEAPLESTSMESSLYLIHRPLKKGKERKQLDVYHTPELQDKERRAIVEKGLARNYQTSYPGVMREGGRWHY